MAVSMAGRVTTTQSNRGTSGSESCSAETDVLVHDLPSAVVRRLSLDTRNLGYCYHALHQSLSGTMWHAKVANMI